MKATINIFDRTKITELQILYNEKHYFLNTFGAISFSFKGYSQSYEVIYMNSNNEIQSKIDQNKVAGIEILTGIWSHQTIGLSGLNSSQKMLSKQFFQSTMKFKQSK